MPRLQYIVFWLCIFAVSMAFLESSVVVYLRLILYPEGFGFPLKPISGQIVLVELWREAATIFMLISAAILTGKNSIQKFAFFLLVFAVWDIFYYIFLKLLISWPESWMTWDVLFLIPVTWTGPVLSPVITSVVMIFLAAELIYLDRRSVIFSIGRANLMLLIGGALVLIVSFCWDYSVYMLRHYSLSKLWSVGGKDLHDLAINYIPRAFNWPLFGIGLFLIFLSMISMYRRHSAKTK